MDSPLLYWLNWLVKVAAGVAFVIKFRGTKAATLGGIGFGLMIIVPLFMGSMLWVKYGYYNLSDFFSMIQLAAWGCILAAFLLVTQKRTAADTVTVAPYPQPQGELPVTTGYQMSPRYYHPSVNKGFYLASILGGIGVSLLLGTIALAMVMDYEQEEALPLILIGFLACVYAVIILTMLVHRLWTVIQPGHPRTTPGQAVGFLFIPLFNFYWIFQAYYGWAQDYNRHVAANSLPAPRVSEGFALTVSILTVCSIIPYLGILIALINMVFVGMFLSQAIDGLAALMVIHDSATAQQRVNQ